MRRRLFDLSGVRIRSCGGISFQIALGVSGKKRESLDQCDGEISIKPQDNPGKPGKRSQLTGSCGPRAKGSVLLCGQLSPVPTNSFVAIGLSRIEGRGGKPGNIVPRQVELGTQRVNALMQPDTVTLAGVKGSYREPAPRDIRRQHSRPKVCKPRVSGCEKDIAMGVREMRPLAREAKRLQPKSKRCAPHIDCLCQVMLPEGCSIKPEIAIAGIFDFIRQCFGVASTSRY